MFFKYQTKAAPKKRLHQGIASIMIYPLHIRNSTSISQKTISRRNIRTLLTSPTCFCQWRILLPHCKCIPQIFAHLSWHRRILDKVSVAEIVQKSYPLQYTDLFLSISLQHNYCLFFLYLTTIIILLFFIIAKT